MRLAAASVCVRRKRVGVIRRGCRRLRKTRALDICSHGASRLEILRRVIHIMRVRPSCIRRTAVIVGGQLRRRQRDSLRPATLTVRRSAQDRTQT